MISVLSSYYLVTTSYESLYDISLALAGTTIATDTLQSVFTVPFRQKHVAK
jgi:hypothetical protein